MNDIKISIIVPVHNLEKYINKSLKSMVDQTLKEIEIICVNDGSTDGSLDIIKKFAKNDFRIKIINLKEKKGQAYARNKALEIAQGEYIGFVDGDDWAKINMFEKLYNKAKDTNSDITMCSAQVYDELKQDIDKDNKYYSLDVFDDTFDKRTFTYVDTLDFLLDINVVIWNKFYKKSFLDKNKLRFKENYIYEDLPFFFESYVKAKKVSIIRDYLYFYRSNRPNSTMSNMEEKILDRLPMVDLTYKILKKLSQYREIKPKVFGWIINDLFHRYTLISPEFQNKFFDKMKEIFLNLDEKDISPEILKYIYCYPEYLMIKEKSFAEFNHEIINKLLYFKEKYTLLSEEKRNELHAQQIFYEGLLEKTKDSIEKFFIKELENKNNLFNAERQSLYNNFENEKENLQKTFESELEKQKEKIDEWHNDNLNKVLLETQKPFDMNLEKYKSDIETWHNNNLLEKLDEQKTFYDNEINLQRATFENKQQDLFQQIEEQEKQFNLNYAIQKEKIDEWHNNNLSEKLNEQKIFYNGEVQSKEAFYNNQLNEQKNHYEKEIESKEQLYKQQVEEQKTFYNIEIQSKETFYNNQLNEQKNHYEKEIELKDVSHNDKIAEQKAYYEGEIESIKQLYIQQIEEQKAFYNIEIQSKETFYNNQLNEQKNYYNNEIIRLKEQFANKKKDLYRQLDEQKQWFDAEFAKQKEEAEIKFNNNLNKELEEQKSYYEEVIQHSVSCKEKELQEYYENKLWEKQNHLENMLDVTKKDHDKAWETRENEHNKEFAELITTYEKDTKYLKTVIKISKKLRNVYNETKKKIKKITNKKVEIIQYNKTIPIVSVILPIYNVDKYLRQSLDSLLSQTLHNIEIICINDGSTDRSKEILDEYAQKDSRIKVLHKKNEGTGIARNTGLKLATGECIAFVDPDDWVKENMFERLYNVLREKNVDISMCMPGGFDEEAQEERDFPYFIDENFKAELDNKIFNWQTISPFSYPMCVWNKLYRKELFDKNNITFAQGLDFEDHKAIFKSLICAEKICFIREKLYIYRFNRKGSILTDNNARLIDHIEIFDIVEDILKETASYNALREDFITYKIHNLLYYYDMIKDEHKEQYYRQMLNAIEATNLSDEEADILCQQYSELSSLLKEIMQLQE